MKNNSFIVLLLTTTMAALIQSQSIQLCGTRLSDLRDLVCFEEHNKMLSAKKRGSPSFKQYEDFSLSLGYEPWSDEYQFEPWTGRRGALGAHWSRDKRYGIADECCIKPCHLNELKSYC